MTTRATIHPMATGGKENTQEYHAFVETVAPVYEYVSLWGWVNIESFRMNEMIVSEARCTVIRLRQLLWMKNIYFVQWFTIYLLFFFFFFCFLDWLLCVALFGFALCYSIRFFQFSIHNKRLIHSFEWQNGCCWIIKFYFWMLSNNIICTAIILYTYWTKRYGSGDEKDENNADITFRRTGKPWSLMTLKL